MLGVPIRSARLNIAPQKTSAKYATKLHAKVDTCTIVPDFFTCARYINTSICQTTCRAGLLGGLATLFRAASSRPPTALTRRLPLSGR
jgi:hypothetical protein